MTRSTRADPNASLRGPNSEARERSLNHPNVSKTTGPPGTNQVATTAASGEYPCSRKPRSTPIVATRKKSTGPRSAEGKERARFNALKHGATAQIPVLPGEDPAQFLASVEAYKAKLRPQTEFESDLVERMALMKLQFDRANRDEVARMTERVVAAAERPRVRWNAKPKRWASGCSSTAAGRSPLIRTGNSITASNAPRADVADDPDHPVRPDQGPRNPPARAAAGCSTAGPSSAPASSAANAGSRPRSSRPIRLLGWQPLDAARCG